MSRLPSGTRDILSDSVFPCPGAVGWFREVDPCGFSSKGSLGTSDCIEDLFGGSQKQQEPG